MESKLELSMDNVIDVFYRYSGQEGNKYTLTKRELKNLLETELPSLLKDNKDNSAVDQIMSDLDSNKDDEVDFKEFVVMVVVITVNCSDFFVHFDKFCQKAAPGEGRV